MISNATAILCGAIPGVIFGTAHAAYSFYTGRDSRFRKEITAGALLGSGIGLIAQSGVRAMVEISNCLSSRKPCYGCNRSDMAKASLIALPLIFMMISATFALCRGLQRTR